MVTPTYDELIARLADLEEWRKNLKVADLPIKQIQDKMEQDWQPNAQTLLGAKSITAPMLGFDVTDELDFKVAAGVAPAAMTWPGTSPRSTNLTLPHGLNKTPVYVGAVAQSPSASWFPVFVTDTYNNTNFIIRAITSDGSSPAAGTSMTPVWFAIYL